MPGRPVVAVDIGGTKIAVAVVAADGSVAGRACLPTPAAQGADAVLGAVVALVAQVSDRLDIASTAPVGVGTAGVVDPDRGVVVGSTDAIRGWLGTHVAERLGAATGREVAVVNDVVAFLHGELAYGAARGLRHVLAVTVGTGIGGALLVDGRVLRGRRDAAGEVGHVPAGDAAGRACPCGQQGHVQAVASGPAMEADYARRSGRRGAHLPEVVALQRAGDPVARSVLEDGGAALGATLGGLVNAVAPELVVLGGGVVVGADVFVEALIVALRSTVLPVLADVRVERGRIGGDATLVGAAVAARHALPRPA